MKENKAQTEQAKNTMAVTCFAAKKSQKKIHHNFISLRRPNVIKSIFSYYSSSLAVTIPALYNFPFSQSGHALYTSLNQTTVKQPKAM